MKHHSFHNVNLKSIVFKIQLDNLPGKESELQEWFQFKSEVYCTVHFISELHHKCFQGRI